MSLNVFLGKDDMNKLNSICSLIPFGKEIETLGDFCNYQNLVRDFCIKLTTECTSTNKLIATLMALESYGEVCVIVHESVNEYKKDLETLKGKITGTITNIPVIDYENK